MADLTKKPKGFTLKNNTLKRVVKDVPERKVEVEIGDSKELDFKPQFKVLHFDNEYNVSVRAKEHPEATVKIIGNKIRYETPEYTVVQYDKPEAGEDGGHELEWELSKKPESNILPFTLRYKGNVRFYHQPALTPEEIEEGAQRPDNVVGSYAVYIDKKNHVVGDKNYATGKIEHIYRPEAIDAEGTRAWCKLNIPEAGEAETNIECSVEVPQEFLDKAVYPVVVDPTFGYTSIGATSVAFAGASVKSASQYTLSEAGDVTKITVYQDTAPGLSAAFIYDTSAGNANVLLGSALEDVAGTTGWSDFTLSTPVSVVAGDYFLGVISTSGRTGKADSTGTPGTGVNQFNADAGYPNPSNPFGTPSSSSFEKSIYATYTPSGGGGVADGSPLAAFL